MGLLICTLKSYIYSDNLTSLITFGGVEEIGRISSDHLCELSKGQILISCRKITLYGISVKEQMNK